MKNTPYNPLILFAFSLFSCQSKTDIKPQPTVEYTIHNYKIDDDELAKRKIQDSINSQNDTVAAKE